MEKVEIRRIVDFRELVSVMPLVLEGFEQMNKRYKAFGVTAEQFTKEMIRLVGSQPNNGVVVVWVDGEPVGYGAARENSELFSDVRQLLLYALYVKPKMSRKYSKPLFDYAERLARLEGYDELVAYNGRFSGAGFRLFEKVFGMQRQMIRFNKKIR